MQERGIVMALRLAVLKNVFNSYHTRAYPLVFLFLVLIYFILREKKEQRSLLIYEIFGILLLITPFIGNKIVTLGAGEESNWPVYGILCVIPVTAYVAAEMFHETKKKKERFRFLLLFFIIIQLGLGFEVTGEQFIFPTELQKTSVQARKTAQALEGGAEWYVMLPKQIAGELRECDDSIRICYVDDYTELQKDLSLLQSKANEKKSNCIILEEEYDDEDMMQEGGYDRLTRIEGYIIYIKRGSSDL